MKEIFVTESFLGLDRDTRNCQNTETNEKCKTRVHLENLKQKCGCLPLSLRLSMEVKGYIKIKMKMVYTGCSMYDRQRN